MSKVTITVLANTKFHVRFRLAPRSMILDDLELLYKFHFLGISREFADWGGNNG